MSAPEAAVSRRSQRLLRAAARWAATIAVVLAAWLFGSTDGWAYILVSLLAIAGGILWLLSVLASEQPGCCSPHLTVALVALIAFVGLQAVPLPAPIVDRLNPLSMRMASLAQQATAPAEAEILQPAWGTLSVAPAETRRSILLLVAYAMTFLVLANTTHRWHHLRQVATILVVSGFIMAIIGMVHKFSGARDMLWFHTARQGGSVFGAFTNRNHFAAHMNMILGLVVGLLLAAVFMGGEGRPMSWRERLLLVSTSRASRIALLLFAIAIIGGSVIVSVSRGGFVSLLCGLAVMQLMNARRHTGSVARYMTVAVALVLIGIAAWLGWEPLAKRFDALIDLGRDPFANSRALATLDALQIYGACPLTGSGFGSFQYVFPVFQTPRLEAWRWLHAHNDWAQMLAEGGMVGGFLFTIACLCWLRCLKHRWPHALHRAQAFLVGAMAGIAALAVHSMWDYSLHKPGNAFLLSAMAGLAMAAVHVRRDSSLAESIYQPLVDCPADLEPTPLRRSLRRASALTALVALSVLAATQWTQLAAETEYMRFVYLSRLTGATLDPSTYNNVVRKAGSTADQVAARGVDNPEALREMAADTLDWAMDPKVDRSQRYVMAGRSRRLAAAAVSEASSGYLNWLALARAEALMGQWDRAEDALERARRLQSGRLPVRMFMEPHDEAAR